MIDAEIELKDVLCFESELDDTFTLFSKNEEHNGLICRGTNFDLAEDLENDKVEFMSEYITQKIVFDEDETFREGTILKNIIYNPFHAKISYVYIEENKYDTTFLFLDTNERIICQYETYWTDEDVYWYKNFKNQN